MRRNDIKLYAVNANNIIIMINAKRYSKNPAGFGPIG
jgi:hypothetical protein